MKLTDTALRHAKCEGRGRKLADGHGLYLLVRPSGSRYWRWKYRYQGKEKLMAFGVYPIVTLAQARERHRDARLLLASGIDPMERRKGTQQVASEGVDFQTLSKQWFIHWSPSRSKSRIKSIRRYLDDDILPRIGKRRLVDLTPAAFRDLAKRIEARGAVTVAREVLQVCSQILRYAVAHDMIDRNPVGELQAGDVLRAHKRTNHARVDARDLPALLRAMHFYPGGDVVRLALRLLSLTFVRTGELLDAEWHEIDLAGGRWHIPAERMKMDSPHIVPLSRQAVEAFETLRTLHPAGRIVFPGRNADGAPLGRGALRSALSSMGYGGRMTGHGFRGVASTILHEQGWPHEHIELQLAHQSRNSVSAAYNHALYLQPRAEMMQAWADYLDARRGEGPGS
ncbi:Putative prophage CPS-53 integrase [Achromobacter spanius]|uniref:tyrosine-type recombinase/integrase n=1 Tax=Achromobacter spanius TaxID=217203 RepID=UPI000C2B5660|nr:integrase arm-type DNA-binding domain-containing protein [Achromobacter spanius]AUA58890.1 integrase [Achromobacter spanius]CAB3673602.1 Prophage integrase IntS [Achromobacter spanius]VEE58950.1 Putative prophage CPS-53 integrase [Achromobacter spanius]